MAILGKIAQGHLESVLEGTGTYTYTYVLRIYGICLWYDGSNFMAFHSDLQEHQLDLAEFGRNTPELVPIGRDVDIFRPPFSSIMQPLKINDFSSK